MPYYDNIENCPLESFKQVQLKNDYKYILISGDYDESKAKESWLSIIDEYQESVKSNRNNTLFEYQKQYHIVSGEYQIIKACLFVVSQKLQVNLLNELMPLELKFEKLNYDEEVKILNQYGYKMDINNIDKELIRVEKQSKNKLTQIKIAQKRIEDNTKDSGNWTINDTIFSCQKHQGFPFAKDAKVIDLVVCLNDLIRNNEMQKAQLKKKKHGK